MSSPVKMETPGAPSWMMEGNDEATSEPSWAKTGTSSDVETPPPPQPMEIVPGDTSKAVNTGGVNGSTTSAADAAANKTWGQYFGESFQRDGRLFLITLLVIVLMNIPFVKWALYPFTIFSTWIHELCHGLAAEMAGGNIAKLEIFPDTSGLAYTSVTGDRRGFVISAGYQGTAVIGCLLLIFRRTKRGPRTGTMAIAVTMVLSVMLWIRNWFGIVFILFMGLALGVCAWKLPSTWIRNLYILLGVTCSLNAITSVQNLFGSNHTVNGEPTGTDAHSMADAKGGSHTAWAMLWLVMAIVLTILGILFAVPGPDEVADFTCCGVCQDFGLFKLCNYPGLRLTRRFRQSTASTSNEEPTSSA